MAADKRGKEKIEGAAMGMVLGFEAALITIFLFFDVCSVFSFAEPDGFAGLKWGSSLAEIKAKHKKVIKQPSFGEGPL